MAEVKGDQAKHILLFYIKAASQYKKHLVSILAFVPMAVLATRVLPPLILAQVIERLSNNDFEINQPFSSFGAEILIYAVLILSSSVLFWRLVDINVWRLEGKVQRDLAQRVFKHLMNQSSDFHANHFGGSLVSQNNKLLLGYVRIADTTIFGVYPLLIGVFTAALIMSFRSPLFSIILIVFALVYMTASFALSRPIRKQGAIHATQDSRQTGALSDAITNVLAIKSFAKTKRENRDFATVTDKTYDELLKTMRIHQKQMLYFSSMTGSISVISLIAAVVSVVSFNANIGTAFLIFSYTAQTVSELFQFSNQSIRNYNRAIGDSKDMIDILENKPEILDPNQPEKLRISDGLIRIQNVSFQHNDADQSIFDNLSLSIAKGEKVGLVGHSGSGKSTLTKLLLRFSDVDSGSITIDTQDVRNITQEDLRSKLAYVPQEPLLFHRTISENIGYGAHTIPTEKEIISAAKKANAHEFIKTLPKTYNTLVGERGIKLSGGQRQRVAIARAMIKDAPILLLDEATSALDSESEQLIQDALWKLMEGKTAIVIAHRLSTIQKMDRIIVLDNGKIIEDGSHKDLLKKKGHYAKLWKHQSGGFLQD